jgi:3-oxoacyl-[acyl-carrier protein] reductase
MERENMSTGPLDGRVALVTGAGRGIGRAIVRKLVSAGARVLANDLDANTLSAVRTDAEAVGGTCAPFPGDVTAKDFGDRAVAACIERLGGLDILINNAGYVWNSRVANHTDEQWYAMIDVHATGPFRLLRDAGRQFREGAKDGGATHTRKIGNASSVSSLFAMRPSSATRPRSRRSWA